VAISSGAQTWHGNQCSFGAVRVPEARDVDALLADDAALRDLLRGCEATQGLADGRLIPLAGGLSNCAWRLEAEDGTWFVRRAHLDAARLGVDRRSECIVLHAVAAAGLSPPVLACDPAAGLLVTRFVAGQSWQAADVAHGNCLHRIAGCLRRLHQLAVPVGVQDVSYERQAGHLAGQLPAADPELERLQALATAVFARLRERQAATVLCHHDLHHQNMIEARGRLWLVDWEYSGRGDPLFDVAGFLAMHQLGPGPSATFVRSYGRLTPADRLCLDDARWVFDYVQWLWYRLRFPDPAADPTGAASRLAKRLLHCDN
jgi:thiamine kinase-like enzyme